MSKLDKNIKSVSVNTPTIRSLIIGSFFLVTTIPANAQVPITQQVKEVVTHLVGVMDTSAQAKANPESPNVRMITCQVQVQNTTDVNSNAIFSIKKEYIDF